MDLNNKFICSDGNNKSPFKSKKYDDEFQDEIIKD